MNSNPRHVHSLTGWRAATATWSGAACMSAGPHDPPPGAPPAGAPERTFTQDDLNRLAAREKDQGERAGRSALLSELGLSSVEDLKGIIDAARKAEESSKSEAQRLAESAAADRAAAKAERETAASERRDVRIERALLRAGASPDRPAGAEKSPLDRLRSMLSGDVAHGADDAAVAAAVTALKAEIPALFAATPVPPGTVSDPGAPPAGTRPGTSPAGGAGSGGPAGGAPTGTGTKAWGQAGRDAAARRRPAPRPT